MGSDGAKIRFFINGETLFVEPGAKVIGLLDSSHGVDMPCGGRRACGKCMVYAEGGFGDPSETEREMLEEKRLEQGIRLACFLETVPDGRIRALRSGQDSDDTICLGSADEEKASSGDGTDREKSGGGQEASRRLYRHLGAAVDIGTTTIAASLYRDGVLAGSMGAWNPQSVLGADVISRIEASLEGKAQQLAERVQNAISQLLVSLSERAREREEEIETVIITGNTAMLYFLTGKNPYSLSRAPFEADELFGSWTSGEALGLCCKSAKVYLPRCISAFVGADITTAILGSGIRGTERGSMMADIGTNGEIVLFSKDRLLCCATAAGPAFEGAGISCGMRGINGAIDHVKWENGGWKIHVIGEEEAMGICGSGVIDGVAALLESGLLDETGYLEDDVFFEGEVGLSAADVRQVQLAKSAIRAGMETMLLLGKISSAELDCLYVAGGFGSYMSAESAEIIGLFPTIGKEKIKICGNAALAGAARLLHDSDCEQETLRLAERAETVNLGRSPEFQDFYMEYMMFEE